MRLKNRFSVQLLALIICMAVSVGIFYQPFSENVVSAKEKELRGVWVSTVGNIDYPTRQTGNSETLKNEMIKLLDNCKSMGFNAIFFQVRPASDAFYKSEIFPWSRYITGKQGVAPDNGFDPLAFAVEEAHKRGMELHAWINPYRITSSSSDNNKLAANNPAVLRPELVIKDGNGKMYYNPGEVDTIQLIVDGALEIVQNYDVDGLHMDDYFYPDGSFNDDGTYSYYKDQYPNKADWRRAMVNQLVIKMDEAIHAVKPEVQFGISPRGIWANDYDVPGGSKTRGGGSYNTVYADSKAWVENGWVDYIMPQIYWNIGYDIADYNVLCDWWSDLVNGTDVKLYIGEGAYRTVSSTTAAWSGQNGVNELRKHIQIGRENENISGYCMFTYNSFLNNTLIASLMKEVNANLQDDVVEIVPDKQEEAKDETPEASTNAPEVVPEIVPDVVPEANPDVTQPFVNTTPSGPVSTEGYVNKFTDLEDYWWALEEINALAAQGIIRGQSETIFAPGSYITRADNTALLLRILGKTTDFAYNFNDVSPNSYYFMEVGMAKELGIARGDEYGNFNPTAFIKRQDMATMAYRVLLQEGRLTSIPNTAILNQFIDKDSVDSYAMEAMAACVSSGLIKGDYYEPLLKPQESATRVEVAIFMYRIQQMLKNSSALTE